MIDWLSDFMARERLPESFRETFEEVCWPLADRCGDWRRDFSRTAYVGLCGPQGSGKTTISAVAAELLRTRGLNTVVLSLDDFYLGREARARLAARTHRLLQARGPPGTHDVAMAGMVMDQLRRPGRIALPAFDKSTDEPRPKSQWPEAEGPADVVILEGWCVGAKPEPTERLRPHLNLLERQDDPTLAWRTYVNRQLGEAYQGLFARLDRLVLLQPPGFEVVRAWRGEQEAKLRERTGRGMSDVEVGRFIQHYERITRWILEEMPARADWVAPLAADRTPIV